MRPLIAILALALGFAPSAFAQTEIATIRTEAKAFSFEFTAAGSQSFGLGLNGAPGNVGVTSHAFTFNTQNLSAVSFTVTASTDGGATYNAPSGCTRGSDSAATCASTATTGDRFAFTGAYNALKLTVTMTGSGKVTAGYAGNSAVAGGSSGGGGIGNCATSGGVLYDNAGTADCGSGFTTNGSGSATLSTALTLNATTITPSSGTIALVTGTTSGTVPVQTGGFAANDCLKMDASGRVVSNGAACAGGSTPGGSDTQVQFNDATAFGGDAGMVYNKTTDVMTLAGNLTVTVGGSSSVLTGSGLGVGVTTSGASGLLQVNTNGASLGQSYFSQHNATADSFDFNFQKGRGTLAAPTTVVTADELGVLNFQGYSGAGGYVTGAAIKAISSGTIATTRVPASLSFWTGTDAAPTVLTQRMVILNSGFVGIANASPAAALDVTGSITLSGTLQWNGQSSAISESFGMKLAGINVRPVFIPDASLLVGYNQTGENRGVGNVLISGQVGIGTSSPTSTLHVVAGTPATTQNALLVTGTTNAAAGVQYGARFTIVQSTTAAYGVYLDGSTNGYSFFVNSGTSGLNGRVYMPNLTTSAGTQTSVLCGGANGEIIADSIACIASTRRVKHDIFNFTGNGLDIVDRMQPVTFVYNNEGFAAERADWSTHYGFVAEDVEKIDARLVAYGADGLPRTVQYENYTAVLTKAVQELKARVVELEGRLK